jgi:hypothetical protein
LEQEDAMQCAKDAGSSSAGAKLTVPAPGVAA